MKELTIQPQKEGKGRAFSATLVSYVEIRELVPRGNDTIRPVFMALAGSDNELRPFIANLRTGKKAENGYKGRERFEVLKSAGYQVTWQRSPKGSLVTLFAPDLFALDPGMVDPRGVSFCILPARRWLQSVDAAVPVPECVPAERADDVRQLAPLFAAFLDRRTRCPLVPDPRFYVQLLANALDEGLAAWGSGPDSWQRPWATSQTFTQYGCDELGFAPGIVCRVAHDALEAFLAKQVTTFFGAESAAA